MNATEAESPPEPNVLSINHSGAVVDTGSTTTSLTWEQLRAGAQSDPLGLAERFPKSLPSVYNKILGEAKGMAIISMKRCVTLVPHGKNALWDIRVLTMAGEYQPDYPSDNKGLDKGAAIVAVAKLRAELTKRGYEIVS